MEISKKYFTENFLRYLKFLELISFVIANLILAGIFYLLIENFNVWISIIYISAFIISLLILKSNFISLLFNRKKLSKSEKQKDDEKCVKDCKNNESINFPLKNIFLAIFKQFFFNVSYELFPLLIVWISWFGLCYLVINIFGLHFNILVYHFTSNFYQAITVLGILLGVYQFYLSRLETKVSSKIQLYLTTIKQIISRETSFKAFFQFALNKHYPNDVDYSKFIEWIKGCIDPNITYVEFFRELRKDPDSFRAIKELIFPRGRKSSKPVIDLQLNYKDQNQKFESIESVNKFQSKLKKSYTDFFTSEQQIENIMEIINDEIDLNEFKALVLSNINIIQEASSDFIDTNLIKSMGESLEDKSNILKLVEKCDTASAYREVLEHIVLQRIFSKLFNE